MCCTDGHTGTHAVNDLSVLKDTMLKVIGSVVLVHRAMVKLAEYAIGKPVGLGMTRALAAKPIMQALPADTDNGARTEPVRVELVSASIERRG